MNFKVSTKNETVCFHVLVIENPHQPTFGVILGMNSEKLKLQVNTRDIKIFTYQNIGTKCIKKLL